jgi:predicted TPR repeat methyltransferase
MRDSLSLDSPAAILTQAMAAHGSGEKETAIRLYKKVTASTYSQLPLEESDNKELIRAAIEGLQACGGGMAAITALETAINQWPGSPMFLTRAANAYENIGNYERASQHLQTLTERFPDKSRYFLRLANAHAARGNWESAEAAYARTLAIAPLDSTAALHHGDACMHLGRVDDAMACYRKVVKLFPDHVEATTKLGGLLASTDNFEEAIKHLRHALSISPKSAATHVNLGSALHYCGLEEESLLLCRKAMNLDPDLPVAREVTGTLLLECGHFAEATEILGSVDPAQASILGLIAKYAVAIQAGNVESAERALQRALSMNPQHGEARHLLAAMHGEPVSRPAPGFVESIFSRLAGRYDQRMAKDLAYQVPRRVAEVIAKLCGSTAPLSRWLDLGCGTGLMAAALDGVIEINESVGVDITQGMLKRAGGKNLYHQLILCDATDALGEMGGRFDLITAIDLLAYLGDVSRALPLIASRLAPDGIFIYTHEQAPEGTFKVGSSGRFAHNADHLEKLAIGAGLEVATINSTTLQYDKGEEVQGFIVALSLSS